MTVTCCFCDASLSPSYPLATLIQDFQEVLTYIAPLVLCVVLWKLFVTNKTAPPGDVIVLGLDANDSTCSPRSNDR